MVDSPVVEAGKELTAAQIRKYQDESLSGINPLDISSSRQYLAPPPLPSHRLTVPLPHEVARKMLAYCTVGVYTRDGGAQMVPSTRHSAEGKAGGGSVSITDWLRSLFPTFQTPAAVTVAGTAAMSSTHAHGTSLTLSPEIRNILASELWLDGALYAGVRDRAYAQQTVGSGLVIKPGKPCPCENQSVTACWSTDGTWCIPQGGPTAESQMSTDPRCA